MYGGLVSTCLGRLSLFFSGSIPADFNGRSLTLKLFVLGNKPALKDHPDSLMEFLALIF